MAAPSRGSRLRQLTWRPNLYVKPDNRHYSAPPAGEIPPAKQKYVPTSGTYPKGFLVSGTHVGVKPTNKSSLDLAFIASEKPCAAAAVFTKNKFQAAPVTVSRELLERRSNGSVRGVIVNAGCANAVTGKGGLEDAEKMVAEADRCFGAPDDGKGGSTIVMSTGVIGQRLPIQKILHKIPAAFDALGSSHEHWLAAAKAICTTDTFPKLISKTFTLPSSPSVQYSIAGMTKGAGMIHPNMATLLGIIATDAPIDSSSLCWLLDDVVDVSFHSITIDGDTSTNDTVALLANGAAGGPEITASEDIEAFRAVLTEIAIDLAKLVVRNGEGATKFVTIRVTEAWSDDEAHRIASTIARSPLVKTALYGKDANWGRILAAIGRTEIPEQRYIAEGEYWKGVSPEKTSVSFVPTDGSPELKVVVNGEPQSVDETRAAEILEHEDLEILVKLGVTTATSLGKPGEATYWTCDYSHEYITINGDYRT